MLRKHLVTWDRVLHVQNSEKTNNTFLELISYILKRKKAARQNEIIKIVRLLYKLKYKPITLPMMLSLTGPNPHISDFPYISLHNLPLPIIQRGEAQ